MPGKSVAVLKLAKWNCLEDQGKSRSHIASAVLTLGAFSSLCFSLSTAQAQDGPRGPLVTLGCTGPGVKPCAVIYQEESTAKLVVSVVQNVTQLGPGDHFNLRWREGNLGEPQIELRNYDHAIMSMKPFVQYTVKLQQCTQSGAIFGDDNCTQWSEGTITGSFFGQAVQLQSINFPDHFIRHQNSLASATTITSDLDKLDSSFRIVRGLADKNAVSFQSRNFSNQYLRHQNSRLRISPSDGSDLFKQDATFFMIPGLAGTDASFRSFNFPDRFIRHRNFLIFVESNTTGGPFAQDATWKVPLGWP
jgi:Alpha-L-arabinofuranosidase B (ABFB) domain